MRKHVFEQTEYLYCDSFDWLIDWFQVLADESEGLAGGAGGNRNPQSGNQQTKPLIYCDYSKKAAQNLIASRAGNAITVKNANTRGIWIYSFILVSGLLKGIFNSSRYIHFKYWSGKNLSTKHEYNENVVIL